MGRVSGLGPSDFSDSLHLHQLGYSVNKRKVEDLMNVNVFVEVDSISDNYVLANLVSQSSICNVIKMPRYLRL